MPVTLETAHEMLLQAAEIMPMEKMALADSYGRVLAEDVLSGMPFPPFDRSPLDGFAVVAAETAFTGPDHPVVLQQIDSIAAGDYSNTVLLPGTAIRIMTGAPMPAGATGVVRIEDVIVEGCSVTIVQGAAADKNICRCGEEIVIGETLAEKGTVMNAGVMGLFAMMGITHPPVFRKPSVALIATGSEVVPLETNLSPGKIRDTNSFMLSAQVSEAGAVPHLYGIVKDDVNAIASRMEKASDCQLILTTGGASVGDHDLMERVFAHMEIPILFQGVAMKPGMPVIAGCKAGTWYISLSGNPAAAAISFEVLIRPLLLKMGGRKEWMRTYVKGVLTKPFTKPSSAKRFVWSTYRYDENCVSVTPLHYQGNGMLKSAAAANALLVIPANSPALSAGETVDVLILDKYAI